MSNSNWQTLRFGDVARTVRNVVDPETSGLERYIAGEHMDTDDLRLRRWGTVGDGYLGPAFHMKFEAGQILYGSRRTYLRKVALADFDGICANTTFVIEAIPDRILPELLPFIMQTEPFTQNSILRSRGSTNPYVTWSDIASYELPLPPLDEQRRIAEILWAMEETIEGYKSVETSLKQLVQSLAVAEFEINDPATTITLGQVCSLQSGYPFKSSEFSTSGDRLLRCSNVGVGYVHWGDDYTRYWPTQRREEVADFVLCEGDIVIAMDRPFITEGFKIARVVQSDLPALLLQRVGRFILTEQLNVEYLWAYLHSQTFRHHLIRNQQGTDLPHISKFDVESAPFVLKPQEHQVEFSMRFKQLHDRLEQTETHIEALRQLKMMLLRNLVKASSEVVYV